MLLALATDLLTPLAIWKGVLPAEVRWISHAAVAGMIPGNKLKKDILKKLKVYAGSDHKHTAQQPEVLKI